MAFTDFTFPDVQHVLGLTLAETNLYATVPEASVPADFVERLADDVALALAIHTEKARSEFIIAPVLSQLRRQLRGRFALFSGISFDVDASRGLNGDCDFILSRSPMQLVSSVPVVAIVEAKSDNIHNRYGQCIAAMVAARDFNASSQTPVTAIHGVVTTGNSWKFLRLVGNEVTFDAVEYPIVQVGRILGILTHLLTTA